MPDTRQNIIKEIEARLEELKAESKEMKARRKTPGLNILFSIFDIVTPSTNIQVTAAKRQALTGLKNFLETKNDNDLAAFEANFNKYYRPHDGSEIPNADSRVFASTGFGLGKTETLFNKAKDFLSAHEKPDDSDSGSDSASDSDSASASDSDSDSDSASASASAPDSASDKDPLSAPKKLDGSASASDSDSASASDSDSASVFDFDFDSGPDSDFDSGSDPDSLSL